ncbi:MarR family winged helix-turn-helix transcriptional regulator [Sphingomonas sp. GlSt437]|uniref:MarR family winged helix-turn-helix transcriptional regulator n=1 Tax=Sphingomonas sp. GlSt437 TaxID=3389970 RepID=UPI003A86139B
MTALRLDRFLPYRLSIVSNSVSAAVATSYQALFGLKIPEWRIIAVIAEGEAMTQQAIGARTRMDKVTVSRAAIALVERGLLDRRPNPDDQRSHLLSLSPAGRALYENVAPQALALEARMFGAFSADEIEHFTAMLDRIEAAAAALEPERT